MARSVVIIHPSPQYILRDDLTLRGLIVSDKVATVRSDASGAKYSKNIIDVED